MIDLHFHWAWILFVILISIGLYFFFRNKGNDSYGIGAFGDGIIFLLCILAAMVVGGIWLW